MRHLIQWLEDAVEAADDTKVFISLEVGKHGLHIRGKTWRVDDDRMLAQTDVVSWFEIEAAINNPLPHRIQLVEQSLMKEARKNG